MPYRSILLVSFIVFLWIGISPPASAMAPFHPSASIDVIAHELCLPPVKQDWSGIPVEIIPDGFQLGDWFCRINQKLTQIGYVAATIASGYSETERVRQVQALGAGAYVWKPYSLAQIAQAVRQELDR